MYLDEVILSAEHGPRGGDEINKIVFGGNYGWPISSYGEPYFHQKFYEDENSKNEFFYKKSPNESFYRTHICICSFYWDKSNY